MNYKFVNEQHEKTYHDAKALLASEDARQKHEAERMASQWASYPENVRRERAAWLTRHFHECRQPYIKLLTDILALATPIIVLPAGSVMLPASDHEQQTPLSESYDVPLKGHCGQS